MLRRWVLTLLTLVVLWAPHLADAQSTALPAGVSQVVAVEGITEYRLPNGLQVLLVPDDAKPTTTVNVTYRVGSRHESYGETGMAHLLEHLIFKGTPTTRNVLGEFSKRGMRANGTTWFDRTNYFASFAANDEQLRWYLAWQADAMVNSFIAKADLDTEMTVVRNEMESGENNPFRVLLQKAMASMYQWHNYGKSTIGARSDVENVDIARLQAFYRQHYQPDNATLTVAGKFDAAKVLQWVAESFGPIPKPSRALQPTYTIDPAQDGETAVTVRRVGGTPLLLAGFHVPAGASRDFAALSLLSQVMGTAPAGRLHKRLTEKQLAAATFGFAWGLAEPGPMFLGAQLSPGQDVDKARAELLAAIDGLATEPVTGEELERVRKQWLNAWELGFTDPERVGVALSDAISRGDWRLFFLDRNHVRTVAVEDINRVAAQYLKRDNLTLATYLPVTQTDRAPAPAKVDLASALKDFRGDAAASQVESFDPTPENLDARTQLSTLPSGLKLALLPKGARGGVAHARLALRFGDVQTLQGFSTVSALGASLIDKGGAGLTRQQIRDRLDALRAQVSVGASDQGWSVNITTVRQHLPEVVRLVGQLLRQPAFPADALEEVRRQALSGLEQGRKEPGAVVADVLARHGNPYARGDLRHAPTFDEREQDLKAVTVGQLRDFHSRFLSAAHGQFSAVGDFDAAALREALATALGDWKQPAAGAARYVRAPQPLNPVKPERFVVRTPDKQRANLQAQLALALNDLDADRPAVLVGNFILGGNPASRLWARVREKEGLSYDVGSFIGWNPVDRNSTWTATAIFAPENQPKVETAVKEEIARVLREGVSAQELAQAQQALLNQRRLSRAQDPAVAGGWQFNQEHGRTFAQSRKLDDQIAAVTVEQVNAALRRHLDPARIVWAWAGDFKQP